MPSRDWGMAIQSHMGKGCRVCGDHRRELAHLIGRRHDERTEDGSLFVHPLSVVPLCSGPGTKQHHALYDAHQLDLLPFVLEAEQAWCVGRVGLTRAYKRLTGCQAWEVDVA